MNTFHKLFDCAMYVDFDPRCVVEPDGSAVVRHAAPVDDAAREAIALQRASRLRYDPEAVAARERMIRDREARERRGTLRLAVLDVATRRR